MPERDPDPALLTFGANVRRIRGENALTQEDLAHAAGLNVTHVARIERGERQPGVLTIARLQRGLAVPLDALFAGVDPDA